MPCSRGCSHTPKACRCGTEHAHQRARWGAADAALQEAKEYLSYFEPPKGRRCRAPSVHYAFQRPWILQYSRALTLLAEMQNSASGAAPGLRKAK